MTGIKQKVFFEVCEYVTLKNMPTAWSLENWQGEEHNVDVKQLFAFEGATLMDGKLEKG